jgi:hypothetical protein
MTWGLRYVLVKFFSHLKWKYKQGYATKLLVVPRKLCPATFDKCKSS